MLFRSPSVPYTDRGREAFRTHDSKDDPTSNCWFPGVPRIMQSPYPAQIVQTDEYFLILFEYMHMFRSIPLNNRPHPKNMEPMFMGDSTGHWEGDTIVVDTVGLKDAPWTWLDTAGHQHSDELHVIERFERVPEGMGIGLYSVKRMATLLGQSTTLASVPGKGTAVGVSLALGP